MPPQLTVTEGLAYSTLRLRVALADGRVSTGTGFFYNFVIGEKYFVGLVTCRHVFEGGVSVRFHMTRAEGDRPGAAHDVIDIMDMQSYWCAHPDASVDLAVMPLYPLFDALDRDGGPQYLAEGYITAVSVPTSTARAPVSLTPQMLNLGHVVRAEKLLDFTPLLQAKWPAELKS